MSNHISNIDVVPDSGPYFAGETNIVPPPARQKSKRFAVFTLIFLLALIASEIYVFIRPAIYQSRATVLTVAKPAIDESTIDTDAQHVAIQQGLLTGIPLLTEISDRLHHSEDKTGFPAMSVIEIGSAVAVKPVDGTHLVELSAEGPEPALLQNLVTTWIEVYQDAREAEVKRSKAASSDVLREEFMGLEEKIKEKREFLAQFREDHDIVSMEREENQILSRLNGLNTSLNTANEDVITAKAELDAVKQAIAEGKPVVPDSEKRSLSELELRAQELRERASEIKRQFTPGYIKLQPNLKLIPEQLKALEKKIQRRRNEGKKFVLSEAQNTYAATIQRVNTLQKQLNEFEDQAAKFSAELSEHNALEEELTGLEEIYRETKERLVKLEVKKYEKYPQVDIVEWPNFPHDPIRPAYLRDASIALIASLLLGLISVWLLEFLTATPQAANTPITLSGVHVYGKPNAEKLANPAQVPAINQQPVQALTTPFPRELTMEEVILLIRSSNEKGLHLIFLLFSGLNVDEAAALTDQEIDLNEDIICVRGDHERLIPITRFLRKTIEQSKLFPAWSNAEERERSEDLSALITCIAIDAGLSKPEEINAHALTHSFIVYLVRQGLRLSELEQIVGPLPSSLVASYGHFSPAGPGISIRDINFEYPGFNLQTPTEID